VAETRIAVVGMSSTPTCGARDHAGLLTEGLERDGLSCSRHWLERRGLGLRSSLAQARAWASELDGQIADARAEAIVLHYSAFAYAHRGVPLLAVPTVAALRRTGLPVLAVLHEFAFSWKREGPRGKVWAASQRAALLDLVLASRALLVTTDDRVEWLASRRWLPGRPIDFAPVFSNLPVPRGPLAEERPRPLIGMFGYPDNRDAAELVLGALGRLAEAGSEVELRLLGAPGPRSGTGETWLAAARARGLAERLTFSGVLDGQALSDALASCELLLFADPPGPTSRKGTLAGSLASGRPLIALDGPMSWNELVDSEAARILERDPDRLADSIAELLSDEPGREALGARGRAFADTAMGLARTVAIVERRLAELIDAHRPTATGDAPRSDAQRARAAR
jgi:glycosyltransferase involved in cell wall biosynthesis